MLTDDPCDLTVRVEACGKEEAFVCCGGEFGGEDVGERHVLEGHEYWQYEIHVVEVENMTYTNVNPKEDPSRRYLVPVLPLNHIAEALVRGVESAQRIEVVRYRAVDHGWTHGCEGEIGVFILDEVPGCLFGEGFAC